MKKICILFFSLLVYAATAQAVFAITLAQIGRISGPTGIRNPVIAPELGGGGGNNNIGTIANAENGSIFTYYFVIIWRALIVIGALATLFNLVNGALEWITAGGEHDKVSHGRQKMTNAVVGMIILAGSFIVISYISSLFKLNLLQLTLPTPGGPAGVPTIGN